MRAYRLAYDGTGYRGFQRQPHGETVEDALFDAPAWLTPRALNGELGSSVRAWAYADVGDSFHATHDAAERRYRYFLAAPDADPDLAATACDRLSGVHDYHNLTPDDGGTVRDLSTTVRRDGEFLVVDVSAGGFARQLVRRLVRTVEGVATGDRELAFVDRALGEEPLTGEDGIGPIAPEPLVLLDVRYPTVEFTVDGAAAEQAATVFERLRHERLASARIAGALVPGRDNPGVPPGR